MTGCTAVQSELLEDNMELLTFLAAQVPFTGDRFPVVPLAVGGGIAVVIAIVSIIASSRKKDDDDE